MNILVLGGGNSGECEVSLRSAAAVAAALRVAGHQVAEYDPADGLDNMIQQAKQATVVFPVLHGQGGEDGSLQRLLEEAGVPFVGADSEASELCFDKVKFKEVMQGAGIPMPMGKIVGREFLSSPEANGTFVLKPNDGGSSIDTYIIRKPESASQIEEAVFDRNQNMLYEELIDGVETTVAVLDGQSLPVIEIIPPKTGEFDYQNKYNGKTQEICPAQSVNTEIQDRISRLAEQVYELSGVRHLARIDIMLDADNNPYVLELNTMPGMTDQSLFPKAAQVAGIPMPDLVDRLVNMAIKDQH